MDTIGKPVAQPARSPVSATVSVVMHILVLSALLYHGRHWIAPIRYPGTENGHHLVLTYLPGRAPMQALMQAARTPPDQAKAKLSLPTPEKKQVAEQATSPNTKSPVSDHPDSTSGADALGSGDISIALAKYFPRPKPDLSTMAPGTKGDVILDIVIDENGKISDLKLVQGIEQKIDETVIATIRQWVFNPANRNGQPVASEQELRFHYEKG
ncbi:energy transducer TonB [Edaphobacter albus]|uniref:energy transducer TonB n=1 Tax=Edaphobacter sp. 4G125 TaxID=2763071 RepID=UPI001645DF67|nr:energy transducer TonB [Edaphobacter sp. 4G125]QNI36709.1 TonB family protein [Edaphobacter sp. 4G125]